MNWNVNNIKRNGRELALGHLLAANAVDIAAITEVELGADGRVRHLLSPSWGGRQNKSPSAN
jgi:hypothetical protein